MLLAPIALAANYAPELPPATVGAVSSPQVATVIGATGSGVVLVNAAAAARVTPTVVDTPGATAAAAPKVPVAVGRIIVAEVDALQPSTKMAVTMLVGGKKVNLGSARTDANGNLTLPGRDARGDVDEVADYLGIERPFVLAARDYYGDFGAEIDVDEARAASVEASEHARWERQQAALA